MIKCCKQSFDFKLWKHYAITLHFLHKINLPDFATWAQLYRVAQKSKPPPNYQKIVSNCIKVCQWD